MLMRDPLRPAATCDQLFVRLRCRRAALAAGAPPGRQQSEGPWRTWRRELAWTYDRLTPVLRRELDPVFSGEELGQLLQSLRFLAAGDRAAARRCLRESLLAEPLQRLLADAPDVDTALRRLDDQPLRATLVRRRLREIYGDQGPGGVEQALLAGLLLHGCHRGGTAAVRGYFGELIDMRNLLAIDRHLRWRLTLPPDWLNGGRFTPRSLARLWQQRSPQQLEQVVSRLAGPTSSPSEDAETRLWAGLGHRLRVAGRDPLDSTQFLDYLVRWRLWLRRQTALQR